jgi:hypothetical protein
MTFARTLTLFTVCLLALFTAQARADTVVITGGGVVIQRGPSVFNPTASFDLQGGGLSAEGTFPPFILTAAVVCSGMESQGCAQVPLGGVVESNSFTADFNGMTLVGGFGPGSSHLTLVFAGGAVAIPPELLGASRLRITAPFTMTGFLSPPLSSPLMTLDLSGQGVLQVELFSGPDFSDFRFETITYTFLPTGAPLPQTQVEAIPEPTTLVLLSTGLAGVVGAARRKRKAQK